jgi:hypothetical protein
MKLILSTGCVLPAPDLAEEVESSALVPVVTTTVVMPDALGLGEEELTTSKAMAARNFGKLGSLK